MSTALLRNLRITALALVAAALTLPAASGSARAEWAEEPDEDIVLTNTHFGLHLGASLATGAFGTGALIVGIHSFSLLEDETTPQTQTFFLGLTLVSLGAASIISSVTGAEANVRYREALQKSFSGSSAPERRLLREAESERLLKTARNRAVGLAADGTFLGIGIVMLALNSTALGVPLVVNGAFILGLDIFKLVVDDQVARLWATRSREADSGYFGARTQRPGPRVLGWGASPVLVPDGRGGLAAGSFLSVHGIF